VKSPIIDVVVVNWNAGLQLRSCVDSIFKNSFGLIRKVIVIDNGSTDNSCALLGERENLEVVLTGENLGFATACNLGASKGEAEYILFLNPDAELYEETIGSVVRFMNRSENSKVGVCGVQLIDEQGQVSRSCARFPSSARMLMHTMGVDRVFPALGYAMTDWDHLSSRPVDHVIGAFYFVRRHVFKLVGGFDERFFVYLEDLDLSYRISCSGWSSFYLSTAQAFHAGGGASRQIKARRLFYSLRSRLIYIFKNLPVVSAFLILLSSLFFEPVIRSMFSMVKLSLPALRETWSAYLMLYRWLPKWIFFNATR